MSPAFLKMQIRVHERLVVRRQVSSTFLGRRQAERRYRRPRSPDQYWEAQRLHRLMGRTLERLST